MIRNFVLAAVVCSLAAPACALDGVSVEGGRSSDDDLNLARLGLQWKGARQWYYWDLSFGGWTGGHGHVYDLSVTPVFRWAKSGGSPYLEAAVGAHVLSDLDVGTGKDFSTRFQFGDHLGAGVRFGNYDLGVRLQHLSNGGLRNPNPGINFLILRLQYSLG
ncbi:MAG TPA: acyloxyacyl hydrolase [Burkholderiales bacterium]|nr:acyloxyacyl hydrolase [Burkholderiales bacterium]